MDFILCAESLNKITFSLKIRIFFFFHFSVLKLVLVPLEFAHLGKGLADFSPGF